MEWFFWIILTVCVLSAMISMFFSMKRKTTMGDYRRESLLVSEGMRKLSEHLNNEIQSETISSCEIKDYKNG